MKSLSIILLLIPCSLFAQTLHDQVTQASRFYFADLQLSNLKSILPFEKQKDYESKFNALQTSDEFDKTFSFLQEDIARSPVTQINLSKAKELKKGLFEQIYFAWGYNRDYHSNTDVKFATPDGTFVIHNTVGKDRQSPFNFKTYFKPSNMSIPQYNIELGAMFNQKWGIELKQDHMKLVFDNKRPYEITGDYNHQVVITNDHPTNEWDQRIPVDFDVAKAKQDVTWLSFEHTNGYNYVSLGAVYNENLYKTKKQKFAIDARLGAGAGLIIPKTEVHFEQDHRWNYAGIDNKFHVAGGGVHAEAKLRLTFWQKIFIQAATRGTYIKVKDALVDGVESRMEHIQPIASLQVMGQVGYTHKIKDRKSKRHTQ